MSAAYYPQVQEIYVAYYGRPADPAGLQYWAGQLAANNGNLSAIINAFGNSAESTALYAGATNSAKVTAIFQQLFNRAPDSAGLTFYTNALTAGTMTAASIALNVADGATGVDATYLANKLVVAQAFSDALTTDSAANLAYSGATATTAARALITGVTTSAATTNVASTITSIKAGGGGSVAGQTFTLTDDTQNQNFASASGKVTVNVSGSDDAQDGDVFVVTGSPFDDTFIVDQFLSLNINAGAGTDTLDLRDVGSAVDAAGVALTDINVNLATGVTNLVGSFTNFENVIADDNLGGRLVGTDGANKFTLGESTDTIAGAGGDDIIYADQDTYDPAADDLAGGSGTDTLYIDDDTDIAFTANNIGGIENIVLTGNGNDDVTVDLDTELDATSPLVAVPGGLRKVSFADVPDADTIHEVIIGNNAGTSDINLLGVTFERVTHLTLMNNDAGAVVSLSSSTLDGVERVAGGTGGNASTEDVQLDGGTYNWSKVRFSDTASDDTTQIAGGGLEDVTGSATKAETIVFGSDTNIGTLNTLDLGAGNGDTVTFAGVDVGDLRNFATAADFAGVEVVDFGSATSVIMEDVVGAAILGTIVGNASATDDSLTFADTAGNGNDTVLTAVGVSGVGRIILDTAAGNTANLTIGTSTLSAGTTVISLGSSATVDDQIIMGQTGTDISAVTFRDFEMLDAAATFTTASIATLGGFARFDTAAAGRIILSDSGTLTVQSATDSANDTFDGRIQGFTGADTWTISNFAWNANANTASSVRTGAGNDTVILGAGNTYDTDSANAIMLEAGDDVLDMNVETTTALDAKGGAGTDTILIDGSNAIAAGDFAVAQFEGFEILKVSGATTGAIAIEIGGTDVNFTTIDLSADTAAAGANTIDLDAMNDNTDYAVTVIGGAGADTIQTGATSTTFTGGAGNDVVEFDTAPGNASQIYTFTGGAGADTFRFDASNAGAAVVVTDFTAGTDVLDTAGLVAGQATVFVESAVLNGYLIGSSAATVVAAANEVLADHALATLNGVAGVFTFGGDSYLVVDVNSSDTFTAADDLLVKLTGNPTITSLDITVG
jgi:hypothetical protein